MRTRTPLLVGLAMLLVLPLALILLGGGIKAPTGCPSDGSGGAGVDTAVGAAAESVGDLDADQLDVAEQVVLAVQAFNSTADQPHAAVIALAVARQESGIRNLPYGDRDSLGVFQQRPSQGWGTPAQILDVTHATGSFLQRLVKIPNWLTLPVTAAAADVQRPAPELRGAYAQWVPLATELTTMLWPTAASGAVTAGCSTLALVAGGPVVYPVPVDLAETDEHNWGGHGDHWSSWHTGTDFATPCGTPVLAASSGTVEVQTGPDWFGRWLVKIVTGPSSVATWYAHMRSLTVTAGATVVAGEQIGEVGDLGNTTGCHLHFEVHLHNGSIYGPDNTDPSAWLAAHVGHVLPLEGTGTPSGGVGEATSRVATFNVLGAEHTAPGGNSSNHIDARTRMGWTVQALNDHDVEIVGLQEFEPVQETAFEADTTGAWDHYPHSQGRAGAANVVAWRSDLWRPLVTARIAIPYFHGSRVLMPYVLLQNDLGQRLWVISVHNPADTRGPAQQWRDQAVDLEASLITQLSTDGTPVVLTGDMNDRDAFFCRITAHSTVHAANGGTHEPGETSGGCHPPQPMDIDWVLGTASVTFTGYTSTRQSPIDHASDHPLVFADLGFAPTS